MMLYSIKSNKRRNKILRIIFCCIGSAICLAAYFYGWIFLITGLFLIAMIPIIKDTELHVFNDRFEIDHISTVKRFNVKEVSPFNEIKKVKFDKGFTHIIGALLDPNNYNNETNSKKDTIEVTLLNGSWRIINRIGMIFIIHGK